MPIVLSLFLVAVVVVDVVTAAAIADDAAIFWGPDCRKIRFNSLLLLFLFRRSEVGPSKRPKMVLLDSLNLL